MTSTMLAVRMLPVRRLRLSTAGTRSVHVSNWIGHTLHRPYVLQVRGFVQHTSP